METQQRSITQQYPQRVQGAANRGFAMLTGSIVLSSRLRQRNDIYRRQQHRFSVMPANAFRRPAYGGCNEPAEPLRALERWHAVDGVSAAF